MQRCLFLFPGADTDIEDEDGGLGGVDIEDGSGEPNMEVPAASIESMGFENNVDGSKGDRDAGNNSDFSSDEENYISCSEEDGEADL